MGSRPAAVLIAWDACGSFKNRVDTVVTSGRSIFECRSRAGLDAALVRWAEAGDIDDPGSVPTPTVTDGTMRSKISRSITWRQSPAVDWCGVAHCEGGVI